MKRPGTLLLSTLKNNVSNSTLVTNVIFTASNRGSYVEAVHLRHFLVWTTYRILNQEVLQWTLVSRRQYTGTVLNDASFIVLLMSHLRNGLPWTISLCLPWEWLVVVMTVVGTRRYSWNGCVTQFSNAFSRLIAAAIPGAYCGIPEWKQSFTTWPEACQVPLEPTSLPADRRLMTFAVWMAHITDQFQHCGRPGEIWIFQSG